MDAPYSRTPSKSRHHDPKQNKRCFNLEHVCLLENIFFFKMNFKKMNYFFMFGSVMKNKLENIFQYLVMS